MISGETNPSLAIPKAAPYIFDFNYPFYDESKREQFQEDFLRHFYFREIGQETYARFSLQLQDKFVTKMDLYNKLFKANEKEFDIFVNDIVEETTTREHADTRNNTDSTETTNTGKNNQTNSQTVKGETTGSETRNGKTSNESSTSNTVNREGSSNNKKDGTTSQTVNGSETAEGSRNENGQESDLPQGNLAAFNDDSYMSHATKGSSTTNDTRTKKDTTEGTTSDTENGSTTEKTTESGSVTDSGTSADTTETQGKSSSTTEGTVTGTTEATGSINATRKEIYNGNDSGKRIVKGTHGNQAEMLKAYYESVRNIKEQFYDECEDLFMLIWAPNPDMFNPIWG